MPRPSEVPLPPHEQILRRLAARLEACASVTDAAEVTVETLVRSRLDMPSVYFEHGGRLRCAAARGYWQVLDGVPVDEGIAGRALHADRPTVVRDAGAADDLLAAAADVTAEVCVPLYDRDVVRGIVNVATSASLTSEVVAFVTECAALLEVRVAQLGGPPPESPWEHFGRLSAGLNECETREEVLDLALCATRDLAGTRSAAVVLGGGRSEDGGYRAVGVIGPLAEALAAIPTEGLAALAAWTRKAAAVCTIGEPTDRGFLGHDHVRDAGVARFTAVPLTVGGQPHGFLLGADDDPAPAEEPTADGSERFELLGAHVAAALQRVESVARLRRQTQRDSLTDLGHNASFHAALKGQLASPSRPLAVCLVDLDGFKRLNDTQGHVAGDELLVRVARALVGAVRDSDQVFRLGGDEFAALLPGTDAAEALTVAQRLCAAVRGHGVTASVGVAVAPPVARGRKVTRRNLVADADLALYEAKRLGGDRAVAFHQRLRASREEWRQLTADLAGAIGRGELFLEYQPVVSLRHGVPIGVEALARWRHPVRGLISPLTFVPAAERSNQITTIGRWVLREACRRVAELNEGRARGFMVGVNVSIAQIRSAFVDEVEDVLESTGLAPNRLVLEMTESTLFEDPDGLAPLAHLRARDVHLAVDDFGTGYSSFSRLRELPIDVLKIDGSFVSQLDDPRHEALVRAIVEVGRVLELGVVGEGIETAAQAAQLRAFGCPLGQGSLFAPALSLQAAAAYLDSFPVPVR